MGKLIATLWSMFMATCIIIGVGCAIALFTMALHAAPVAVGGLIAGGFWGLLSFSLYDSLKQKGLV